MSDAFGKSLLELYTKGKTKDKYILRRDDGSFEIKNLNIYLQPYEKFEDIQKKALTHAKGKILDLGSGSGRYLRNIKDGKMFLIDFSDEMIKLAKQKAKKEKVNAEFVVGEMTKLPYENNFFDYAFASSSFHCLKPEEHKKAVEELYRVLKKGGEAEISVWNCESIRFKNSPKEKRIKWRDKGTRYYYLFSPEEIYKLFEKAGFKIISKEDPRMMIVFIIRK